MTLRQPDEVLAWNTQYIGSIAELSRWFSFTSTQSRLVYRGQADSTWRLQSSIDRHAKEDQYEHRLREEEDLLKMFTAESLRFLDRVEAESLKPASDKLVRMAVMQHFGAQTRLLDWTESVLAACYFACIDECNRDGAVWWIDHESVEGWLDTRWHDWGFSRRRDKQIILDPIFFNCGAEFVCMQYLRLPFRRIDAQRGLFTFASRLGLFHDEHLGNQVAPNGRGRVEIAASLKPDVIKYLERLGVNAISLQHNGADRVGFRMASARSSRAR